MRKKLKPLEYAFYLLELRDRSIGEIEAKLKKKEFETEEIEKVMHFLIEKKFLDDKRFAENYTRFKKTIKPVGKYYLRGKLLEKKVPVDIIDQVLSDQEDQVDEVIEAAKRWILHHEKIPKDKRYEKLSRHLVSRGFDWEKIKEVLDSKLC